MQIGNKIKQLRTTRNLTQKQFGEHFHVSDKTVSKWERDISSPDLETIQSIASHFDVDVNYFFIDNKTKIRSSKFKKWLIIACCLLIPALIVPLMPLIVDSISSNNASKIVTIIYMTILIITSFSSIAVILWQLTVVKKNTFANGLFYFNWFFGYTILFLIGYNLISKYVLSNVIANTPIYRIDYLISNLVYLMAVIFLFYLRKPLNLTFQHNKTTYVLLGLTGLSFLLYLITPIAAIAPWTKNQALILTIIALFAYTKISFKPSLKRI